MENISVIIDYIAETNLFNFAMFVAVIVWICLKIDVRQKLEDAKQKVCEVINQSVEAKENSEILLKEVEESLTHIGEEVSSLMQNSTDNAEAVGQKALEDAKSVAVTIEENVEKAIENNQNVVRNDLIKRASFASIEMAKLNILEELKNNQELHDKLIDESIRALEGVTL